MAVSVKIVIFSVLLFYTLEFCNSLQYEVDDDTQSLQKQEGKKKLEEIRNTAEYSICWKQALDSLHSSCRSMSDDDQRRLALAFANCHFESSNRGTYPCPKEVDISECTSKDKMDDAAFQVYTEFFTHSSNICYFVQSLMWQEATETTINKLSDASEQTVEKLEESLEYHKQLSVKQTLALKNQEVILDQDYKISQTLENTKSNMDKAFQEMHDKAESQKVILDDVLSTLRSGIGNIQWIMSSILGEIITLETAGFFIGAVLVITFFPQFGTSRLWLFCTLMLYGVLEGMLKRGFFKMVDISRPDSMSSLHSYLWYSRCLAILSLVTIFYWRYVTFTGQEKQQLQLFKEMKQQLHDIQQSLPCSPHINTPIISHVHESFGEDTNDSAAIPVSSGDDEPCVVPLRQYYQNENTGNNIVSGTQLVDFLSGIYIKDSIRSLPDIDVCTQTTTDDTYRSLTDTESDDTIDTDITSLTRTTLSRSNIRRRYLTTPTPSPPAHIPLDPVSSNDSFMTAQSTVSINLERCVPPTNNTHSLDKDLLDSSIVRESTPIITERRMDGPRRQRKRRTPVPRYHYPKHVEQQQDDDSGFSTDGNSLKYTRYNLRSRN